MAMLLRMQRMRMALQRGMMSSPVSAEQGSRWPLGGAFLRSTVAEGGRRKCWHGAPFSSWTGEDRTWASQPYQRSKVAMWGDWACVGLVFLMGGVFWSSMPPRDERRTRTLIERLEDVPVVYEALRYSVKKKLEEKIYMQRRELYAQKVKQKRLCLRRIIRYVNKLATLEVQLQGFKQMLEWCLDVLEAVVRDLEDALLVKVENAERRRRRRRGEHLQEAAVDLLRRMAEIKRVLSASSGADGPSMLPCALSPEERAELEQELLEAGAVVIRLTEAHAEAEALIVRNRGLRAELEGMLLELYREE